MDTDAGYITITCLNEKKEKISSETLNCHKATCATYVTPLMTNTIRICFTNSKTKCESCHNDDCNNDDDNSSSSDNSDEDDMEEEYLEEEEEEEEEFEYLDEEKEEDDKEEKKRKCEWSSKDVEVEKKTKAYKYINR